ncbi:DUF501 domain-containing protein [Marinobacterium sediminicola]|uniref:DUF501 domain-containing protein n=1 Tax=Marinobacterium sediminicola TaxID=518898 RepID=A0ABY1RZ68_9GAMM|nr:DUF501 domain-containing protein [Marinobacterium sediminicola]ULG69163.1 DUF501 domain-containing protein [Marinobacterium sediminicola]SMR73555.1 hypothetical protein SAMN04487964_10531 [Marinobacterium sediminicola]
MHKFDTRRLSPTAAQLALIEQQIGREPRGIEAVACATTGGLPLVLQMRTLVADQPFPTLYWLSCRDLCRAIGRIEDSGWVKQIEQELQDNEALRTEYLAQQQRYVELRWRLMRDDDRARIEQLGFTELFDRYGIGGIAQWDKVRCLHMQYAHWLADGDNVIGERLEQEFALSSTDIRL